ncbi:MAG: TolC family protein [Vicinamibacterales bacterium]|nr:TolC family protein [Vicinamibacterales bacterium]
MKFTCFFTSLTLTLAVISPASAQTSLRLPSITLRQAAQTAPVVPLPASAARNDSRPRVALTLDEAVKRALEQNLDIAVQRINLQTFDVSLASLRSVYSPTLTSTLSTQTNKSASNSTISGAQNTGDTITSSNVQFNGGIQQQVAWHGGSFSAQLNNNRQTTTSLNSLYNPSYTPVWSATYTQPLLRNFSTDSTHQQILVTKINQEISDLQLQQVIANTLANVRNAYWDAVFSVLSVEIARGSLDLAEELMRNNQSRVDIGTMAPIDVVQAQSQAAAQRQALVTAEGTMRTAEIALKRLIVSGTSDPLWTSAIDPVDRPEFRPEPIDLAAATQRALAARTDVQQAKKTLEANGITMELLKDQVLPQADLVARYGTTGQGGTSYETIGNGVNRIVTATFPGGYGDALNMLLKQKLPSWNFAVNFSYPLGTSAADASVARARIQQNQIDAQLKQMELQVTSDVNNAAVQVENAAERVQAAQVARDLAQQQLDAENSKFAVGISTNYAVVLAQRDLISARNNALQAILAYRRALVEFDRVQQTGNAGNITVITR